MSPTRIGVNVNYAAGGRVFTVRELVEQIGDIQRQGFAFVALAQLQAMDALIVIATAGQTVPSIEFMTAVIPIYPRHPIALAQQALTAQDATGSRLTLGIGLSHAPAVENACAMALAEPLGDLPDSF